MTTPFMRSYAELLDQDLPPPRRPRDGRHGGADPDQERPGRQRRGVRQGAGRQGARSDRRPRRHLGRAPGPRAGREGSVRPAHAGAQPDCEQEARRRQGRPPPICIHWEPEKPITEKGVRLNINVAIQYLGAWLAGQGCVPIFNLMEDAATAEISRSQVWQWIRSPKGVLDDGRKVTKPMVAAMIPEEVQKIRDLLGPAFGARQVRRRGGDLRRPRQQRHVRRVPHAPCVRSDRLIGRRRVLRLRQRARRRARFLDASRI